ncbi:alpha amylase [Thioploca ingrica]|uniref:Alpha amylase n=1 Tax=Thioploca ingrica TaxID=40754 RepID=A0A090AAM5_9GAMM|nr:alpha amylase [Thioploca ingrica]
MNRFLLSLWLLFFTTITYAQEPPRTVFVHLFEWRWDDIAKECETFLGPKGFAAVQVSPPNEHRVVPNYPWWERYQPVSYQLVSRSGDRQSFTDMVKRCQAVGVKIYVDAVINHMTGAKFDPDPTFGTGIGGTSFDYYKYPDYNQPEHFHACNRDISDYHNKWEVQNCNLVKLADLNTGSDYVQQTIANYLNDLVNIGVKGFRIDAAKHIDTNELHQILAKVNISSGDIYQEVIETPGEPIQAPEYFQNGLVTEFDYGKKLAESFKGEGGRLANLKTLGDSWQELMPSNKAVVFTDNHDKQRGHGGGGNYLTYKDGKQYELANVFMLAWPYGYPQIMSSYAFDNTDAGPPSTNGITNPIYQGDTPNCFKEWVCEHRWRSIANMVAFRNYTASASQVGNWWDNGNNQIAFSRGDKGFVVINKESTPLEKTFQTGLPAGQYCNTWDSELVNEQCTGTTITVNEDGTASVRVEPWTAAAIHVGFKPVPHACHQPTQDWKRTVVFIYGKTLQGQDMFIRGGIDHDYAKKALNWDCSKFNYNCAIPIHHRNLKNATTKPWKEGDCYLDWYGQEPTQTSIPPNVDAGSPADWTTNQWPSDWGEKRTVAEHGFGEEPLNQYGHHYWMLDVDMDCSKTVDGWFELKSYISNGPSWEKNIQQPDTPYVSINHVGKCGYINVFKRNEDQPVAIKEFNGTPQPPPTTLGADYRAEQTTFSLWSPDTSQVQLWLDDKIYPLQRALDADGYTNVYSTTVPGDHRLKKYHFQVNGKTVRDPYGVMVVPNTDDNVVIDLRQTEPEGGWAKHPPLAEREDSIIYEVHVRDFTIDETAGVTPAKRGKFLGMVETGSTYQGQKTGLDHLLELGVTHVQLLPFYDFTSCPDVNDTSCYNWGYDPRNYNVPEERYALNPNDYEGRIRELKTMINAFHQAGIRVIMDVVYNHTHDQSMFAAITSKYYLASDLTGVGNTLNANEPMVSRMIRDSLEYWVREYHLDGFRFDLMGVFNHAVVSEWGSYLNKKFPDRKLLLYGEPWNGGKNDPIEGQRIRLGTVACTADDAHIGVFNPKYRDAIKGNLNDGEGGGMAFNQGDLWQQIQVGSRGAIQANKKAICPLEDRWDPMFASDPEQSINYVSCHDNLTLWDKIQAWAKLNNRSKDTEYLKRIQMFANGMILTSQGIPFIHAGEEMLRTKEGDHNSYKSPDSINKIRWNWKAENEKIFKYYKDVIALRRAHPGLRMNSWDEIDANIKTSKPRYGVVVNQINAAANSDEWKKIIVIYNSADTYTYPLPAGIWHVAIEKSDVTAAQDQVVSGQIVAEGTNVTLLYQTDQVESLAVKLISPAEGTHLSGISTVTAEVSGDVKKVEFYVDSDKIGEDANAPYTVEWNTTHSSNGEHQLTAKVYDNADKTVVSAVRSVIVDSSPKTADFREETIYFLLTTRFYDGDPDNNYYNRDRIKVGDPQWRGDFKGLIEKLDYIKNLGFTAIWITPPVTNRSGLDYHGYHAYDWTEIDPRLESTGATYQDFINAAHAKGLKVIQDVVINHSSNYGIRGQVWIDHLPIKYYRPQGGVAIDNGPYQGNLGDYKNPYREDNDNPKAPAWFKERQTADPEGNNPLVDPKTGETVPKPGYNPNRFFGIDAQTLDPQWYHLDGFMAGGDWENPQALQRKHMAGDTIDLATENQNVKDYLNKAIFRYLDMGVDAIRLDTVKHVERNNLLEYVNAWKAHKPTLFVFGENLVKGTGWGDLGGDNGPSDIRPWWYTRLGNDKGDPNSGGESGLSVLDFSLFSTFRDNLSHGHFGGIGGILNMDWVYGDATKLVTFLQNHDVGPDNDFKYRFKGEQWMAAVAYNLLWTIRGIPCLYYGEEIEFMKGAPQDISGNNDTLDMTGRAYFGDHLLSEKMAETQNHPLYKHIQRLNLIRRNISALQKAPMSAVSEWGGGMSFVRDYHDGESYVVVGLAAGNDQDIIVNGVRKGTYKDAVTGHTIEVANGTLSFYVKGKSAGIYVLNGSGKIGEEGVYLK